MNTSNHTEIVEGIILARLPEIVRHYDRNSERSSHAVGNAVKAIIDVPAAVKAMGSKTTKLAIQCLSYTARRMMDTSVMNASGARYLLQRSLENVRIPAVIEEFKTRFSKSGERTRAPTIEGLKITLDTRKADRPGLDIQDLTQVKELMAMSRRLGPKAGTAVVKKPKDTTPAPALTVMEDAEAVKQEKAVMPEFKKDITPLLDPLLDMQPLAEANPALAVSGWTNIHQSRSKFVAGDLVVVVDKASIMYKRVGKIMIISVGKAPNFSREFGCLFVVPGAEDPEAVLTGAYLDEPIGRIVYMEEHSLEKYDPLKVHFPEDGVLRGQDSSMVVIDETENPPPIKLTDGEQPPEGNLEESMVGVDLGGAMVDHATKDLDECLAPSSLRISYSRALVANIKKLQGGVAVDQRALEESNPAIALGQVWEDADGKRHLVSIYNSPSEDYNTLVELSPPYHVRRVWDAAIPPRTMVFLGLADAILGTKDVV
jgi:hypothetical protein